LCMLLETSKNDRPLLRYRLVNSYRFKTKGRCNKDSDQKR